MTEQEHCDNYHNELIVTIKKELASGLVRTIWYLIGVFVIAMISGFMFIKTQTESSLHQTAQNAVDVKRIEERIETKADMQFVLQMKAENDKVQQMILENTRDLKVGQQQLLGMFINHINETRNTKRE